jgi:hypothetical protein
MPHYGTHRVAIQLLVRDLTKLQLLAGAVINQARRQHSLKLPGARLCFLYSIFMPIQFFAPV